MPARFFREGPLLSDNGGRVTSTATAAVDPKSTFLVGSTD
jgi:hypothetical protein